MKVARTVRREEVGKVSVMITRRPPTLLSCYAYTPCEQLSLLNVYVACQYHYVITKVGFAHTILSQTYAVSVYGDE